MISSVSYTSTETAISITLADGSVWHDDASLPADTALRRELAEWLATGGVIEPYVAPPAGIAPPPNTISRRQCAAELFAEGTISAEEAIAMTATATPPAAVEAVLATIPEPDQTFARLEFAAANYDRTNALVGAVMTALGKSDEDRDAFFRASATR